MIDEAYNGAYKFVGYDSAMPYLRLFHWDGVARPYDLPPPRIVPPAPQPLKERLRSLVNEWRGITTHE